MAWGDYPIEYDAKKHGPYDPSRYYGKKDTPFGDVKLGELAGWISRRQKSPQAVVAMCSRGWWRWGQKYVLPKKGGAAPFFHVLIGSMMFFYIINYPGKISNHRNYKYH